MDTLYEYYDTQSLRPTYAGFADDAELSKYAELRKNVFYRLMLPPSVVDGKRLLEFGPDTGENALVFAQWGARLTLVEPNIEAHAYIANYFSRFGLGGHLEKLVEAPLLEFTTEKKFDLIDAEGFIYTIQPNSVWIKKTAECLETEGFLVISYYEPYGCFMELLHKAIYSRVKLDSGYDFGIETAKYLFLPKWNSIQHTRKIESWFMDVIENPFVRKKYFIDAAELLRDMRVGGFRLYSSWPNYRDVLSMRWIKAPLIQEDELRESISFVEQSRLNHLLGCRCLSYGPTQDLSGSIASLIRITDELIDQWSPESCVEAGRCVDEIESMAISAAPKDENIHAAKETLAMIRSLFKLLEMNNVDELVKFCRSDKTFISTWGVPWHYAIFQRAACEKEQI